MSKLTFLPAPWYVAVPDFDEEPLPQEEPFSAPPPISFEFWILALALALLAIPDALSAQSSSAEARKILAKPQKFELGAEIEGKLRNRERMLDGLQLGSVEADSLLSLPADSRVRSEPELEQKVSDHAGDQ